MPATFELVIPGPPVSQQTRHRARRRAWVAEVASRGRASWPAERPPWTGAASVRITHYFAIVPIDLDNLPKPILDGLKGIVIADDGQVEEIVLRRLHPTVGSITDPSPMLAAALAGEVEFLHILVESQ